MVLLLIFVMDPLLVFSIHLVEYLTSMCIRFLDTALDISDDTLDISDDTFDISDDTFDISVCGRARKG